MEKNREQKLVTTYDGSEALRTECRYIKGKFYKVGDPTIENSGQCYKVDGLYCRANTGYIVYDHGQCRYVKKTSALVNGIIDVEDDKETLVMGYFTPSDIHNVKVTLKTGGVETALLDSIFENTYYREIISTGNFSHISAMKAVYFNRKEIPSGVKHSLSYDSKGIMGQNIELYNQYNDSVPSKPISEYAKYLDGLTFGLEFETSNGFIPKRITSKLGLLPLRDGSIRGLEYVTIPLEGAKGLQTVVDSCKELKRRTEYNSNCSLHLHLGGVPRTMEYIISLYRLLAHVQDEMYLAFPLYKKTNYGIKKKAYTKPLPILEVMPFMDNKITDDNIIDNFDVLYQYLSMGQSFKGNFKSLKDVICHPSDPNGTSKWNIKSRYHWFNFIPLLFGNKQTVEFRIHTSTVDHNRILNFMYICAAIVKYAEIYQANILKDFKFVNNLRLRDIIRKTLPSSSLCDALTAYFDSRKYNIERNIKTGDVMCKESELNLNTYINWDNKRKSSTSRGTAKKISSRNPFGNANIDAIRRLEDQLRGVDRGHRPQVIAAPPMPRRAEVVEPMDDQAFEE